MDEISAVIIEELDLIEEYISNIKNGIQKNEIQKSTQKDESFYKNEINLKYLTKKQEIKRYLAAHLLKIILII